MSARAAVQCWSRIQDNMDDTYTVTADVSVCEGGNAPYDNAVTFVIDDNDSAAQIKSAMATAIRAWALGEGYDIPANGILLNDGTRV